MSWVVEKAALAIAIALLSAACGVETAPSQAATRPSHPRADVAINPLLNIVSIRLSAKERVVAHVHAERGNAHVDCIVSIRLADGKVEQILDSVKDTIVFWRALEVTPDGQCIFLKQDGELTAADVVTGKIAWHWNSEDDRQLDEVLRFSSDGRFATTTAGRSKTVKLDLPSGTANAKVMDTAGRPTAVMWDLQNGKAKTANLDFLAEGEGAIVLPVDASRVLVLTKNQAAVDQAHKYNVDELDLDAHKRRPLFEVYSGLSCLPMPSGKEVVVLRGKREKRPPDAPVRGEFLVWSAIERWDVAKPELIATTKFKEPFDAGQVRLAANGKFVLFQEVGRWPRIWDVSGEKWVDVSGPDSGCVACDISRDGTILVAAVRETNAANETSAKLMTVDLPH